MQIFWTPRSTVSLSQHEYKCGIGVKVQECFRLRPVILHNFALIYWINLIQAPQYFILKLAPRKNWQKMCVSYVAQRLQRIEWYTAAFARSLKFNLPLRELFTSSHSWRGQRTPWDTHFNIHAMVRKSQNNRFLGKTLLWRHICLQYKSNKVIFR